MGAPTDFDLLDAWRDGDRQAGGELFDRHLPSVSRFFRNKVDGTIDDLVQDTFLACVEARDRFSGRSTFRTYLFSIARNVLFGHYRKRAKAFDPLESTVTGLGTTVGTMLARSEEQALVLEALRALPVDLQVALELYYWEQLTSPELAEILEISPNTARSRLSRGRAALRAQIEDRAENPTIGRSTVAEFDVLAAQIGTKQAS